MADDYKFPDEVVEKKAVPAEAVDDTGLEVEIVDDTPAADRNRTPLPEPMVKALEADDGLEEYDDKVKNRLSQLKKVWHDERRSKESAIREREEAMQYAEAKDKEIRELRTRVGQGERLFVDEVTKSATGEIATAKQQLKQAYEAGDAEAITDAQEALTDAKLRMRDIQAIRTTPVEENDVQSKPKAQVSAPVVDEKAESWRTKNTWFGPDRRMTGFALGLHQELVESGVNPSSDEYYEQVNAAVRQHFPDRFESEGESRQTDAPDATPPRSKAANVVASVSRTTAPKRIRLTQSQLSLAKRLGLTPEAYARETMKLETQ
jgi:hypothetical protein